MMKTTHQILDVKRNRRGRPTQVKLLLFGKIPWTVRKLLSRANPKVSKVIDDHYLPVVMHLAPHHVSGNNTCAWSTEGCRIACLNLSGRGRFDRTQWARIARTALYFLDREVFRQMLTFELEHHAQRAHESGLIASARLNGTSDLRFYRLFPELFDAAFPIDLYWDYTKDPKRAEQIASLNRNILRYHLTFSHDGSNWSDCQTALQSGSNVAVVYRDKQTVQTAIERGYRGWPVIDGDKSDQRYLDPIGSIVGLYAKGPAKQDRTGFVVDIV